MKIVLFIFTLEGTYHNIKKNLQKVAYWQSADHVFICPEIDNWWWCLNKSGSVKFSTENSPTTMSSAVTCSQAFFQGRTSCNSNISAFSPKLFRISLSQYSTSLPSLSFLLQWHEVWIFQVLSLQSTHLGYQCLKIKVLHSQIWILSQVPPEFSPPSQHSPKLLWGSIWNAMNPD